MAFRPRFGLRNGSVVQVVGGTLSEDESRVVTNFTSDKPASEFAALYWRDGLRGGHVIMLGPGNEMPAREALAAYPGGLQVGGGITPENAIGYLDAGASHVIVTSYLFTDGQLNGDRLARMRDAVGPEKLVIDLSCRRAASGEYYVATNRWQTITSTEVNAALFQELEAYCDEFLIHAADVEGKCRGIDRELVELLGQWVTRPATYAGGATSVDDIALVEGLSGGALDLTIGSALDIFGGHGARYEDAARLGRTGGKPHPRSLRLPFPSPKREGVSDVRKPGKSN